MELAAMIPISTNTSSSRVSLVAPKFYLALGRDADHPSSPSLRGWTYCARTAAARRCVLRLHIQDNAKRSQVRVINWLSHMPSNRHRSLTTW
jgi:hypothetical protein